MHSAAAPTREQEKKFKYQPPTLDRQTNRTAYRRLSQGEQLFQKEELDHAQFHALNKLYKHMMGAQGARVQHDDDNLPLNADTEYPITYHNQKLSEAEKAVRSKHTWQVVTSFAVEDAPLAELGKRPGRTSHPVARAYALGKVQAGLDVLADLWCLSTTQQRTVP